MDLKQVIQSLCTSASSLEKNGTIILAHVIRRIVRVNTELQQRQVDLCEFQVSQGYIVRPCLKKQNQQPKIYNGHF